VRTLYFNATVCSPAIAGANALVVDDDTIAWIGRTVDRPDGVHVVDLDGAFVTPTFVDAHVHATSTGLALTGLDLADARSLADALGRIERQARVSRGRPVLGTGWDEGGWVEGRPPTSAELDRATYGGVVYLSRVDAHSAVVSSALIAAADVRGRPGFRADGWLTGEAHDAARRAAFATLPSGARREAQRATRRRAAELGIGCLHEMAGPEISSEQDLAQLLALARDEPGPEAVGYWGELFGIDTALDLGAAGAAGDLFCDGSLGSHTAALHEPYADRPTESGALRFAVEDLAEHLRRCEAAGLQGGFHAIGDAAVDAVLAAAERVRRLDAPVNGAGHRLEHAELVADPERLAASGLIASVQPAFDATWGGPGGMYERRLGPDRCRQMNRFAALLAAGVPLAFGSDAPVTPLDPWGAVRAAAYPSDPAAAISPWAAFLAHTQGGWRAAGRSADGAGTLAPGAPATLAIWDAARVSPPVGGPVLPDVQPGRDLPRCLRTVVRGHVVFDALPPGT
jgi:predicted amidohydrolase YtcJ